MNAVCGVLLFATMACLSACGRADNSITVRYKRVGTLKKGDKVTLNGLPIGTVAGFNVIQDTILTDLSLRRDIRLPVGSRFIVHQSLLGPASIVVEPSAQTTLLTRADTVSGVSYKEPVLDAAKQQKMQAAVNKMAEGFAELVRALEKDSISDK